MSRPHSMESRQDERDRFAGVMRCEVCCGPVSAFRAWVHGRSLTTTCDAEYCMQRGRDIVGG